MATPNTKRDASKTYCDLYNTPREALDALFKCPDAYIELHKTFFEPCNGIGAISGYMQENFSIKMITNELEDHAPANYNEDFLNPCEFSSSSWDFDYIISNPPYKMAQQFVQQGFKYAREQYLLLRLNFLEGKKRKAELFDLKHLRTVYIFSYRISCSKGVDEEPQANSVSYAWYHFDRDYVGNPEIIWL